MLRSKNLEKRRPLQKSPIPLNRYDDDLVGGRSTNKQVARALFGFTAQNKRELSFNKGDIISVRRQIDKNWHEGELRGIVGIFPSNYVEILPAESLKSHVRKPSEGQARARFAFQAQTSMEMSLSKGETVILTRRVDQNWYEGRIGQRRGIFPISYVDVLVEPGDRASPTRSPLPRPALPAATVLYNGVMPGTSSASSTLSGRSAGQQQQQQDQEKSTIESRATFNQQLSVNTQQESVPYRALYNYKPQNEDELELKEGDIVMVMEKCDDGWYVGTSRRTSLFGTFPGNYVERVA
ncbi:SH3 domain [Trinorchestia longiramus]|nr:SH3 domain [Trinorchestia longiramus]